MSLRLLWFHYFKFEFYKTVDFFDPNPILIHEKNVLFAFKNSSCSVVQFAALNNGLQLPQKMQIFAAKVGCIRFTEEN